MGVLDKIRERAKALKKRIALPEGQDERVLKAARDIPERGYSLCSPSGRKKKPLPKKRESFTLTSRGVEIVNHLKDEKKRVLY